MISFLVVVSPQQITAEWEDSFKTSRTALGNEGGAS